MVYDAGQTRHAVRSAELMHEHDRRREPPAREMDVIAGVVRAYYGAVLSAESLKTAREALRSAEADLRRAEAVRAAGMSTDVDVLSIRVHLAAVEEQRIRAARISTWPAPRSTTLLGLPLDTPHDLTTALTPLRPAGNRAGRITKREAAENRPEVRESKLAADLARVQRIRPARRCCRRWAFARPSRPTASASSTRGGANWLAAVSLRWNLFNGFADKARIAEAGPRAAARRSRASSAPIPAVRLQVRRAWADLRAAQQRIEVARAAMAEAEESLRITQNRYEAGLAM